MGCGASSKKYERASINGEGKLDADGSTHSAAFQDNGSLKSVGSGNGQVTTAAANQRASHRSVATGSKSAESHGFTKAASEEVAEEAAVEAEKQAEAEKAEAGSDAAKADEKKKAEEEEVARLEKERKYEEAERERQAELTRNHSVKRMTDLRVDAKITVMSPTMKKRPCTIVATDVTESFENWHKVKVHYNGFKKEYDEWLQKSSGRILGILEEASISKILESAAALLPIFIEDVQQVVDEMEDANEQSLEEVASSICKDIKAAATDEYVSELFASKLMEANDDLDAEFVEAAKSFFSTIRQFVTDARAHPHHEWMLNITDNEAISSIVDCFLVASKITKEVNDFIVKFESSLVQLKQNPKDDEAREDEQLSP